MIKNFTDEDVKTYTYANIYLEDVSELLDSPLDWQKMGLMETSTGYGKKLTSRYKIQFNGKFYRLYVTCYSNNGSTWFKVKGKTIYVN